MTLLIYLFLTTKNLFYDFPPLDLMLLKHFLKRTLQCPCLENARDVGAWWAAVYGVARSQTRLK